MISRVNQKTVYLLFLFFIGGIYPIDPKQNKASYIKQIYNQSLSEESLMAPIVTLPINRLAEIVSILLEIASVPSTVSDEELTVHTEQPVAHISQPPVFIEFESGMQMPSCSKNFFISIGIFGIVKSCFAGYLHQEFQQRITRSNRCKIYAYLLTECMAAGMWEFMINRKTSNKLMFSTIVLKIFNTLVRELNMQFCRSSKYAQQLKKSYPLLHKIGLIIVQNSSDIIINHMTYKINNISGTWYPVIPTYLTFENI